MRKLNKYVIINADLKEKFHYKLYPTFLTLSLSCNCFLPLVIKNKCSKLSSKRNTWKAQFKYPSWFYKRSIPSYSSKTLPNRNKHEFKKSK